MDRCRFRTAVVINGKLLQFFARTGVEEPASGNHRFFSKVAPQIPWRSVLYRLSVSQPGLPKGTLGSADNLSVNRQSHTPLQVVQLVQRHAQSDARLHVYRLVIYIDLHGQLAASFYRAWERGWGLINDLEAQ